MNLGPADYQKALAAAGLDAVTVFHRRTTGSTSDDARALASSGRFDPDGGPAVVVAEIQTEGRGRGTKSWSSPNGTISMTLIVSGVKAVGLGVLPLAVGEAVASVLRERGAKALVKWPNDIMIEGLKVGGILCESSVLGGSARVFIGVGLNVEASSSDPDIAAHATTLTAHGLVVDRPALLAQLVGSILAVVTANASGQDVVERWKAISVPWWGEEVTIMEGDTRRQVTLLDVNPDGQLVVRDDVGVVRSLVSGAVQRLRPAPELGH